MTEVEWLACNDRPGRLLSWLRGKASDRKLRLLACACCHRVWEMLTDERSRNAVRVAELFADDLATVAELTDAKYQADEHTHSEYYDDENAEKTAEWLAGYFVRNAAVYAADEPTHFNPLRQEVLTYDGCWGLGHITDAIAVLRTNSRDETLMREDDDCVFHSGFVALDVHSADERRAQVTLLRDIFGNPFRPVAFADSWRSETTVSLAFAIYAERAFDRMPILADSLEEAGCEHTDILNHCRGDGPHVRGCWVVDLVLGRS